MRDLSIIVNELTGLHDRRTAISEQIDKLMATSDPLVDEGAHERMQRLTRGAAKLTDQIATLEAEHSDVYAERAEQIRRVANNPRNLEYGDGATPRGQEPWNRPDASGGIDPRRRADFNGAMRSIERCTDLEGFSDQTAKRVEKMLRTSDRDGLDARYLAAVGNPYYEGAFTKAMADPAHGPLSFTPEEADAMRTVRQVELQRAMGDVTGSAGGYGLPITIDPSIVLTNVGALNPLRELSRVETISSYTWRGVSSDGVVAAFLAEGTEVADNSPVLVQPSLTTAKGMAFVPYSFEVGMDYPGLQSELIGLLTDAKSVLEATKFVTGLGNAAEPAGILNIGGTGGLVQANSRVLTATTATFAYADLWTLKQAIPVRFLADSIIVMNPTTLDTTYQLSPTGSTTLAWLMPQGRNGPLTGLPTAQLSSLATGTTTGTKTAIAGNFKKGFLIADRLGIQLETVSNIFGAANRFPIGQRGALMWWRVGSTTIGAGSAAGCPLRYMEIK